MTTTSTESTMPIAPPEKVGNEFLVGRGEYSSITNLTNGGFVVSLASGGGVAVEVFDAMGTKVGEGRVSDTIIGLQGHSNITGLTNGGFVLTWTSGNGQSGVADIKAQVFDPTGAKVGSEFLVNTTTELGQNLSTITGLTNGGFVITWVDGSGLGGDSSVSSIKAQVFDGAGGKIGGEFLVNTTTEAQQNFPTITGLSNGGFVITWSDRSGLDGDPFPRSIKAQVFDATGTKVGSEFLVNTTTAGSQNIPIISALNDGGFVIAWSDQGGSGASVKAQVFDATGTKVGSEFPVTTTGGGPVIAGLDGGGFVIAWGDGGSGGFPDVKAQLFDASGAKVGSEFLVNTTTEGYQSGPTITGLSNGGLVVAWLDGSDPSIDLFKAQIFGFNQAPVITTAASQSVAENQTFVAALTSTDVDAVGTNAAIFSITGGADAALFQLVTAADGSQLLQFLTAPDYETNSHNYQVEVSAFDGVNTTTKMITVNVTDVDGVTINGTSGNDTINATTTVAGQPLPTNEEDILNGGAGADQMSGGNGNDVYFVDHFADAVFENAGEGVDTVYSTAHFRLSDNVEHLILQGSADLQGYGNGLSNALYGNSGNNILNGDAGADMMVGGAGNDAYFLDNIGDVVIENANEGSDTIYASANYRLLADVETLVLQGSAAQGYGNALANAIVGTSGDNVLDGDTGADTMFGGAGNDAYFLDNIGDVVVENANEGSDTVYASANYRLLANVEYLVLQGPAVQGYGNALANAIYGTSADNLLDGDAGADSMYGGAGNDAYFLDNIGDVVVENANEGSDTVYATANYRLGTNVEYLVLLGGAVQGYGNALSNAIYGTGADNLLDGDAGANSMYGGAGNDAYFLDNIGDVVVENANAGSDTVYATPNYRLGANVEYLVLLGPAVQGYGNALSNALYGTSADNLLDGDSGVDAMYGLAGNDSYFVDNAGDFVIENLNEGSDLVYSTVSYTLAANTENLVLLGSGDLSGTGNTLSNAMYGNTGANTLNGGAAADFLQGNAGNDTFVFNAGQANGDMVADFAGNGGAAGNSLLFLGFGTAAQGATFTQVGATNQWTIHSGLDAHNEFITFSNGAAIDPNDFLFG